MAHNQEHEDHVAEMAEEPHKPKLGIGDLSRKLFDLKSKKAELNKEVKELNPLIEETEKELLTKMRDEGLPSISNDLGTIYISPQVVPNVINWDMFYEFIRKTNSFHLLERRLTSTAYREMVENGEEVPGVDPSRFDQVRTRKQ
jgi:hypothetical protein